jgi:biopolymer transport protein ExbD
MQTQDNTLGFEFDRTVRKPRRASLVPLIDVSLFLLIFFMVAGSIEKFDVVPVSPPLAKSGKLLDEGHVVILLGTHDEIIIDDEMVSEDSVLAYLKDQLEANPDKIVTLKTDASVPANKMLAMMDKIKAAGGRNLSLVTQSLRGNDK